MNYEFKVELKRTNKKNTTIEQSQNMLDRVGKAKKALFLYHQVTRYMDHNNVSTLHEMAKLIQTSVARLSQILLLQQLASCIQEDILFSDDPKVKKLTERKIRRIAMLISWKDQKAIYEAN